MTLLRVRELMTLRLWFCLPWLKGMLGVRGDA